MMTKVNNINMAPTITTLATVSHCLARWAWGYCSKVIDDGKTVFQIAA